MHILYWAKHRADERLLKGLSELHHIVEPMQRLDDAAALAQLGGWDAVLGDIDGSEPDPIPALRRAAPHAWLMIIGGAELQPRRIELLRSGADAVFIRPYEFRELSAKLDAMARRSVRLAPESETELRVDLLPSEHSVVLNGEKVRLSPREYAFLALLAARPGDVLSPREILEGVWGEEHEPRTELVHAYASRLRAKLERGRDWRVLQSVRGHGYRLSIEPRGESEPRPALSKVKSSSSS